MTPLTAAEAGAIIGCKADKVHEFARDGKLRGWRIGDSPTSPWRFRPADVDAFIAARIDNAPTLRRRRRSA